MNILRNKLTNDIAWTLGSFATLAVSGVVINLIIAVFRDAAALGVFNLSYAIYIIASQIAVFGLQYSVMRHAALYSSDQMERDRLLFSAGFLSLVLGLFGCLILAYGWPFLALLFSSEVTGEAIKNAALGLIFFPLNKVLLGYLNGLREMKAFSILQSWRYVIVMIWVGAISASNYDFTLVTLGFFIAEITTTIGALLFLYWRGLLPACVFDRHWAKRHFKFGGKSLLAGMFVEMNSRVDVLLLGIYLPAQAVGVYSFAAMLVDGLYHVLAMVRLNLNPVLVAAIRDGEWFDAQQLLRRSKRLCYPITSILSICIIFAFWILTTYIVPEKGLLQGMLPLTVLVIGLTCISAYIPFDNVLLASGHPGYQTLQHLTVVSSNVALNIFLIPIFGIIGAAIATAVSYFIGIAALMLMVKHFLGWNLLTNYVRV